MATKLSKDTYPAGHSESDFKCYGPAATKDGDFAGTMICDCGCFTQDGKDSNKYYHGAIVESQKKPGNWYVYFEWGRTGARFPSFQFVQCGSKDEAQREYEKQLHAKNDKRGQWVNHPALGRILQAKAGKDCYLVRPQATRSTGLPDAKTITHKDTTNIKVAKKKTSKKKKSSSYDAATAKLLADLDSGTLQYTRSSMADAALPTHEAIDEANKILTHAMNRIKTIGNRVADQVRDKDLQDLTSLLYSRIPKKKNVGAGPQSWVLSDNTLVQWQQDLAAFESALQSTDLGDSIDINPFGNLDIELNHLNSCELADFVKTWAPTATQNRHSYLGNMDIKNLWKVDKKSDLDRLKKYQLKVEKSGLKTKDKPMHQPRIRKDLSRDDRSLYRKSGTYMLFHGTRSVNVMGILRESLRMPKQLVGVVLTGSMFGSGAYFASDYKKSAGYCSLKNSYWAGGDGGVKNRHAFMFVCDVCLGDMFVAPGPRGYTGPPSGYHSVWGKAGHSHVQNDEHIVYNADAINLKYLIEFDC